MKIFLLMFIAAAVLILNSVNLSRASADIFGPCDYAPTSSVCSDARATHAVNPIIVVLKAAIEVISFITGVAAVILIIVSAIKFVTAGGNANSVSSARSTLVYAVVGIIITVIAQSIVVFVLDYIK